MLNIIMLHNNIICLKKELSMQKKNINKWFIYVKFMQNLSSRIY